MGLRLKTKAKDSPQRFYHSFGHFCFGGGRHTDGGVAIRSHGILFFGYTLSTVDTYATLGN